ncbi:MAG: EamA family transporter, partial [Candidatus Korarchaeota archaeon]|nr:EamA family transporter [Candidatus Korarchaeota archaeon]
ALSMATGELWRLDMGGWGLYALAGVLHYVIGRLLIYSSIDMIGAASASVSASPSIVLASVFAWPFLGGGLGPRVAASVGLVALAVHLAGSKPSGQGSGGRRAMLGLAAGLGSSLVFAITTLLVRYAGTSHGAATAGVFVSYLAALSIMLPYALIRGWLAADLGVRDKHLVFAAAGGVLVSLGQLFRYNALGLAPVALVVVFVSMNSVYAALLSPLVKAAREKPGPRHLAAAALAVSALYLAATS